MYGFHIGRLDLFTRIGNTEYQKWSLEGEQGSSWYSQDVYIDMLRSDEEVGSSHSKSVTHWES